MAAFGLFILGKTGWTAFAGLPPEPSVMGIIAVLALFANGSVALREYVRARMDGSKRQSNPS